MLLNLLLRVLALPTKILGLELAMLRCALVSGFQIILEHRLSLVLILRLDYGLGERASVLLDSHASFLKLRVTLANLDLCGPTSNPIDDVFSKW